MNITDWVKREIEIACARDGQGGSMRIIKQGRPKATKNILRFRYYRCGFNPHA